MPSPLLIFSQSGYLIRNVAIHYILNGKQCRSRSVGFFRSQLIWIYTVCKGRVYPGSAGQGLKRRIFCPWELTLSLTGNSHFWKFQILRRQVPVCRSCLPLKNGLKIIHVYPFNLRFFFIWHGWYVIWVSSNKCTSLKPFEIFTRVLNFKYSIITCSFKVRVSFAVKVTSISHKLWIIDWKTNDRVSFTTLWANSADNEMVIFSYFFFPENKIWHIMQLSPVEIICMKCKILFSGKK